MHDPIAQSFRNLGSGGTIKKETATVFVWLWRYAIVWWTTAVYHGAVYKDAIEGAFMGFYWPLYWFVESVRVASGNWG